VRFFLRTPSGAAGRGALIITAVGIVAGAVAFALAAAGGTTEAGGPPDGPALFSEVSSTNVEPGLSTILGDVNCDFDVDSIDAAFVLWAEAGVVDFMPCKKNANVNLDGFVNSLDAFLILQYHSDLVPALPPPVSSSIGPIEPVADSYRAGW